MATFTTLPDSDLDANSPITEPLMLALRDNPLAIQQGDASAPKIANSAFNDNTINGIKLVDLSITNSKLGASSITDSKIIKTFSSSGTWTVASSTAFTIPLGVYMLLSFGSGTVSLLPAGSSAIPSAGTPLLVISDGTNIRYTCGVSQSATIYYAKLS